MSRLAVLRGLCLIVFICSNNLFAASIYIVNNMDFSVFKATEGECDLDSTTGDVTELSGDGFCAYANDAEPAKIRFVGTPNEDYEFRLTLLAASNANGYLFTPEGTITSDSESESIVVDSFVEVNAGSTGIIEILVGGTLNVDSSVNLQSETDYRIREVFTISWQEAP